MDSNMKKGLGRSIIIYLIILGVMLGGSFLIQKLFNRTTSVTYTSYREMLEKGEIDEVRITQNREVPTGRIRFLRKDDAETVYSVYVADVHEETTALAAKAVKITLDDVPPESFFYHVVAPMLILLTGCLIIFVFMNARMGVSGGGGAGGNPMAGFTRNRAHISDPKSNPIKFKDVAGLQEEKEDLYE
ncbi:MAG: ATP-dependent metallopeptidase FtsH/Yme1/Tma family protein, partial [Lachnospiraceae bacterium]|nr:ATP-dependent metallopeptidase FtsH/Yme1/Tma family protein [Lachnospiraceae bacterium]